MSWRVTTGGNAPQTVERLLRALPQWFGIEASNAAYVEAARHLPAYLAWPATAPAGPGAAGVLLLERHFPGAAEIYLLAVDPAYHRQGAGRALLAAAQASLVSDGVEFLQVKTLGPSHPDEGYQRTRKFYAAVGFTPLEEIHGVWDPENPCLIMIKHLAPGGGPQLPGQE
jgi:ribosomal protein S18 acetylase RimI-like enzyme